MLRRAGIRVLLGVCLAASALYWLFNPDPDLPETGVSGHFARDGASEAADLPFEAMDTTRATPANGDWPGLDRRELKGEVWYPKGTDGPPGPLVIYSHGFMSRHAEAAGLGLYLASHGYVTVAVDYPLTRFGAPGGPTLADVANQVGDLRFVLDRMLDRAADPGDPLYRKLDPERVAAVGLSLGGMTSTLAAFHRGLLEPRLKAAVSIAGPSAIFTPSFYRTRELPYLMIAGERDAVVPYDANAAPIPGRVRGSVLVALADASHTGFAPIAARVLRWAANPDEFGCQALMQRLEQEVPAGTAVFTGLGGETAGIDPALVSRPCAPGPFLPALAPGRQQVLTHLAIYAFLESVLSDRPVQRLAMRRFLLRDLAEENPEIRIHTAG